LTSSSPIFYSGTGVTFWRWNRPPPKRVWACNWAGCWDSTCYIRWSCSSTIAMGLIKLEAADSGIEVANDDAKKGGLRARARAAVECPPDDMTDQPFVTLITAMPTGLWDSGSLKAGESLTAKVVKGWIAPACRLDQGANLYGHVVSVTHSKHCGRAELALVFDRGDCTGHDRQELTLNVIGCSRRMTTGRHCMTHSRSKCTVQVAALRMRWVRSVLGRTLT